MKSLLADIGIAAALALAFMVDEIVARKRLTAFLAGVILGAMIL